MCSNTWVTPLRHQSDHNGQDGRFYVAHLILVASPVSVCLCVFLWANSLNMPNRTPPGRHRTANSPMNAQSPPRLIACIMCSARPCANSACVLWSNQRVIHVMRTHIENTCLHGLRADWPTGRHDKKTHTHSLPSIWQRILSDHLSHTAAAPHFHRARPASNIHFARDYGWTSEAGTSPTR